MIFQLLASAAFLAGFMVVLIRPFSFTLLKVALLVTMIMGGYFIWRPNDLTAIANIVGVGRGADLVNYISTIVLMLFILASTITLRRMERKLTLLSRKFAIAHAAAPEGEASPREAQ